MATKKLNNIPRDIFKYGQLEIEAKNICSPCFIVLRLKATFRGTERSQFARGLNMPGNPELTGCDENN